MFPAFFRLCLLLPALIFGLEQTLCAQESRSLGARIEEDHDEEAYGRGRADGVSATPAAYRYQFNYPYNRYKPRHYPYGFGYGQPRNYPFGVGPYGPNPWNFGGYTGNGYNPSVYGHGPQYGSAWGDPLGRFGGANPYMTGAGSAPIGGSVPHGYATPNFGWYRAPQGYGWGSFPMHTYGYTFGPVGGYGYFNNGYYDPASVDIGVSEGSGIDYADHYPQFHRPYTDPSQRSYGSSLRYTRSPVGEYVVPLRNYGNSLYGTGPIVPTGGFYQGW